MNVPQRLTTLEAQRLRAAAASARAAWLALEAQVRAGHPTAEERAPAPATDGDDPAVVAVFEALLDVLLAERWSLPALRATATHLGQVWGGEPTDPVTVLLDLAAELDRARDEAAARIATRGAA